MAQSGNNSQALWNARRKRRRRKIILRRIIIFLFAVMVIAVLTGVGVGINNLVRLIKNGEVFGDIDFGTPERVEKALELEMPDWVDVELIHKHNTARSGTQLTDIKNIVIHYVGNAGSTAKNNRDYFDKPDTTVSSHFVVGLDGEIIQCIPLYEKSAATNNRNKDTISIEVCHPDESGKYTDKTYASLIKLTAWLCKELKLSENDVIRHYDVTGKICPKYYVENEDAWHILKRDIKESLTSEKN